MTKLLFIKIDGCYKSHNLTNVSDSIEYFYRNRREIPDLFTILLIVSYH